MPKPKRMSVLLRRAAAVTVMSRSLVLSLSSFSIIALSALLACAPTPGLAADSLALRESGGQAARAGELSTEPQGHQMRRYQAFARQAELPSMAVLSEATLQVGEVTKVDTSRLVELTPQQKETLAGLLGVPAGLITKVLQRDSGKTSVGAAELARDLRVAVVDYRFLQQEWGRYHPPAEGQQAKAQAVAALEAGDLPQAWALYDGLSRPGAPAPPTNLRVAAGQ